ncbi:ATP binding protein [Pelomyxa schiedti]|nr:ATP binding protein [Pelomyxa schiedti]
MAKETHFGQFVIGSPGSGKTTLCNGMQQFLSQIGRKVAIVNLDPANERLPYKCDVNISELINLNDVMKETELGPNGALMYCMEYLEKNIDWLEEKLALLKNHYFLFDCPGQVELYTHHHSVQAIVERLSKIGFRLAAVQLVDSFYCGQPTTYIAALLFCLNAMLQLGLPHVNVLSKIDLLQKYGPLAFDLEFYTDAMDLEHLKELLDADTFGSKFKKLNAALCELVSDFNLVSFATLDVQSKESMYELVKVIDKANGYVFGTLDPVTENLWNIAAGPTSWEYDRLGEIRERFDFETPEEMQQELEQHSQEFANAVKVHQTTETTTPTLAAQEP